MNVIIVDRQLVHNQYNMYRVHPNHSMMKLSNSKLNDNIKTWATLLTWITLVQLLFSYRDFKRMFCNLYSHEKL